MFKVRRNPPLCSYALFLILSLTPFICKPDSSGDLTIFIISSISSLEIINDVMPDLKMFFLIAAIDAGAAVVNPKGSTKTLANSVSTLFINSKPAVLMA